MVKIRGRNTLEKEIRTIKRSATRVVVPVAGSNAGNWEFFETEDGGLAAHNVSTGQVALIIPPLEPGS